MLVWSRRVIGKRVCVHRRAVGSSNCQKELTSAKILDLI